MIATLSGRRATDWSKKNPRLRRRLTSIMGVVLLLSGHHPLRRRYWQAGSSKRPNDRCPQGCDEKATVLANLRQEREFRLAGAGESLSSSMPIMGVSSFT